LSELTPEIAPVKHLYDKFKQIDIEDGQLPEESSMAAALRELNNASDANTTTPQTRSQPAKRL